MNETQSGTEPEDSLGETAWTEALKAAQKAAYERGYRHGLMETTLNHVKAELMDLEKQAKAISDRRERLMKVLDDLMLLSKHG